MKPYDIASEKASIVMKLVLVIILDVSSYQNIISYVNTHLTVNINGSLNVYSMLILIHIKVS